MVWVILFTTPLATPKLWIYQLLNFQLTIRFFLPIMATILVVPISRPTAIFSFPLSIYLVQTTCFVKLDQFFYIYITSYLKLLLKKAL
jgi:hypothetical protein